MGWIKYNIIGPLCIAAVLLMAMHLIAAGFRGDLHVHHASITDTCRDRGAQLHRMYPEHSAQDFYESCKATIEATHP